MRTELNNVKRLFCDVLGIRNCRSEDLVQELEFLQEYGVDPWNVGLADMVQLYECLWGLTHDMDIEQRQRLK
jgi:hypothetical protein